MKITLLQKTAMHESGHALLYHLFGVDLDYVSAKADGNGICKPFAYLPTAHIKKHSTLLDTRLFFYGAICCAGYIAESMMQFGTFKTEDAFDLGKPKNGHFPKNDFGDFRGQMAMGNLIAGFELYDFDFFAKVHHFTDNLMGNKLVVCCLSVLYTAILNAEDNFLKGNEIHEILEEYIPKGFGIDNLLPRLTA